MIYCVAFSDVEEHMQRIGFRRLGETSETVIFERGDALVTLRRLERLPEMLMNNAFYEAGLEPPELRTFWCD